MLSVVLAGIAVPAFAADQPCLGPGGVQDPTINTDQGAENAGNDNSTCAPTASAFGFGNNAEAVFSNAFGSSNLATGINSSAIGDSNSATGRQAAPWATTTWPPV